MFAKLPPTRPLVPQRRQGELVLQASAEAKAPAQSLALLRSAQELCWLPEGIFLPEGPTLLVAARW